MVATTVLSSGKDIYVEKHDPTELVSSQDAVPIIFMHGILGSSETFRPILGFFSARTRILFDVQGHGRTPIHTSPVTLSSLAGDVADILAHYGYASADVVAHSGSCYIALEFAASFPEKVRKLVLLGPPEVPASRVATLGNAVMLRGAPSLEPLVGFACAALGKKAQSDERVLEAMKAETLKQNKDSVASVVEGLAEFQIGEIRAETLVIFGTEDAMSGRKTCESVQKATNGRLVEVATGHYFALEDPQATGAALIEFL